MKLTIFLDIDGVLNHEPETRDCGSALSKYAGDLPAGGFSLLCPSCIERLNELIICVYTEAKYTEVVIICSSTWRLYWNAIELGRMLGLAGFDYEIGGRTTRKNGQRGQQILDYIKENPTDKYIALDDDTFDMDLVKDNQVVTNYQTGFDNKALDRAINLILELRDDETARSNCPS